MRALRAADILDLIDAGNGLAPTQRAVLLLRAACPSGRAVESWSLGEVNARLLELRMHLFGRELECLADCPECDAIAETGIDVAMLLEHADSSTSAHQHPRELQLGDERIRFRLPEAADVIETQKFAHASASDLVSRIVLDRQSPAGAPSADAVTLASALAHEIARVDPLAQLELAVTCPGCGHAWVVPLYPIDVLWAEIDAWGQRLIGEVVRLAMAFGWHERDILEMSACRRQTYIEAISA